ncbi:hypothetical protein CCR75_008693 [Bremia lactucae]|uniref:XPG-I domain-containing protein n=1 Tax=Bremia lactucae TaxID=4779 RepID=A0A976IKD4_BRELC|nr:hypothetical protein CCR75_008693 [Bremia lactucae]
MDRISALLHNGIAPYVVFDGGPLPMKNKIETERRRTRQKYRELGIQHYKNKRYSEARKCFARAVDVSPYMAHQVIQQLKARKVAYVVAPYEADAQLAYLVKNGIADGVISEDSDCLPFGCQTVLFKMDRDNVAQEIKMANFKKNKGLSFHMFTDQMVGFRCEMKIFWHRTSTNRCDYLPSIAGFGLKKAYNAMKQHGSFAKVSELKLTKTWLMFDLTFAQIIRALRLGGKVRIPATYENDFGKAVLTFQHQRVYCPMTKKVVPLTPIPTYLLEADPAMDFLGPMLSSDIAIAIANGDMDPITMISFHASISRHSSFQLNTVKPSMQSACAPTAALILRKAPSSFFHASESAAAENLTASQKGPQSVSSKLPNSLAGKRLSKAPTTINYSQTTNSDFAVKPTASPLVASRFFGDKQLISPPNEHTKKTLPRFLDSSTFQSQEPCNVDVAQNVSFNPLNEKTRIITSDDYKENQSPNSREATTSAAQVVKATAFSRMMSASSTLWNQKVKKRKLAAVRSGNLFNAPLPSQTGQLASRINSEAYQQTRIYRKRSNLGVELSKDKVCSLKRIDKIEDSIAARETERCLDTKTAITTLELRTDQKATIKQNSKEAARVTASVASFDRFRFNRKNVCK